MWACKEFNLLIIKIRLATGSTESFPGGLAVCMARRSQIKELASKATELEAGEAPELEAGQSFVAAAQYFGAAVITPALEQGRGK